MNSSARVAVLGASGYTGAELLRLLAGHPAEVTAIGAATSAGQTVGSLYPHLAPYADLVFEDLGAADVAGRADIAFLALPHGESMTMAPALLEAGIRVIDLAGDFRLDPAAYPDWYGFEHTAPEWSAKAVYGLPELFAPDIRDAALVANPGCYPTPVALGLVPLIRAGLVDPTSVVVDAKSGISGAGRSPTESTHFPAAHGSVHPYKAGGVHQHTPEIERALDAAAGAVTFVPHLVPTSRGVLTTCYAPLASGADTGPLLDTLNEAYASAPFVRVLPEGTLPDTKRVLASNTVELGVAVDGRTGTAVVAGTVDNLVKGAAGQAIQNLNLMLGLPEETGLTALAVYP